VQTKKASKKCKQAVRASSASKRVREQAMQTSSASKRVRDQAMQVHWQLVCYLVLLVCYLVLLVCLPPLRASLVAGLACLPWCY
jgi:Flp pilus assembly protein TadB